MGGLDTAEDRRTDKVAGAQCFSVKHALALAFAQTDIADDPRVRRRVNNRPDEISRVVRRADLEAANRFDQPFQ